MLRLFELIRIAAATRSPVLILGETGTGKELVAQAIHETGPCRKEPFVPVDCPALAPTLIESELFGYVRGAFTGAVSDKMGLLSSAGRGTLFLDEIAELTPELQARLLRVIETNEFKPVGSTCRVPFKARILAATHRNLASAVRERSFREDLYFRLNVHSITLPPLRERKTDIPLLAEKLLVELSATGRITCESALVLSPEVLDRLLEYKWPGNVRELRNVLERAAAWARDSVIRDNDLSLDLQLNDPRAEYHSSQNVIPLQESERQAILRAISACHGNKILAARLLGIGKTTLYRKLRTYR